MARHATDPSAVWTGHPVAAVERRPQVRRPRRALVTGALAIVLGLVGGVAADLADARPEQATFAGGNGRIAFTWSRGGEGPAAGRRPSLVGIVSVRPNGDGRRLVARRATTPRYSPSGRRIAFLRQRRLWVARSDGRLARPVTPRRFLVADYQWSPDGTHLGFVRRFRTAPESRLYRVEPDGSRLKRLFRAPAAVFRLYPGAWSRDGEAIAVEADQRGARPGVYIARVGAVTGLAIGSKPTWSRRGPIAYQTTPAGQPLSQVCSAFPACWCRSAASARRPPRSATRSGIPTGAG